MKVVFGAIPRGTGSLRQDVAAATRGRTSLHNSAKLQLPLPEMPPTWPLTPYKGLAFPLSLTLHPFIAFN